MRSENEFQTNLELWSEKEPKAALMLPYVDCSDTCFCETAKGELNLKIACNGSIRFLHAEAGAIDEAKAWFKQFESGLFQILYVYGIGLGYAYTAAKEWLQKDKKRRIVFLEDDLKVIHRFFETAAGTELLKDSQALLYYFNDIKDSTPISDTLFWNFIKADMEIAALPFYFETKQEKFKDLKSQILYDFQVKNGLLDEYLKYGIGFYKNFYPNMLYLSGSHLGSHLFKKFHKVPAIICGAGPSLAKQLPHLQKLKNKALIFAGGSALNALNAAHIEPHFGAGLDPNLAQFDRLKENKAYETPFFYRNRMFHRAFQRILGPRLYIPGSGGYEVSDWFEEKLNIPSQLLDEGHNVVNFALQIAYEMGCDPIVFIGLDLAYTGNMQYAPGVVKDARLDKKNAFHTDEFEKEAVEKTDIYGKPILTLWKWVAEADWISTFAKGHANSTLINATEGGIGIPGVDDQPFNDVMDIYLSREFDLAGRIHGEIQNSVMPEVTFEKVQSLMNEFKESLDRCAALLDGLLAESKKMQEKLKNLKKGEPIPVQSGRSALFETDLAEEIGYRYVLETLNLTISLVLNRELNELESETLSEALKSVKKLEINDKKLSFLKEAASLNSQVMKMTLDGELTDKEAICTPTNIHLKTR